MLGRRLPDSVDGVYDNLQPGDYVKIRVKRDWSDVAAGTWIWIVKSPTGTMCYLNDQHTFVEHDDGTLTVSPSIQMYGEMRRPTWHGYLERGVWREC